MTERAILWGADHHELGVIGAEAVGDHAAIALSYGAHPKHWPSGTPNEDAVAVVVGPRATLLVIADGHAGYEAVPPAVETVLDSIGLDPPPADLAEAELVDLFSQANEVVLAATGGGVGPARWSRTTLALALIAGSTLQWASFGDSEVFVVGGDGARSLGNPKLRFIGYPMERPELSASLDRGALELGGDPWVIVASDGLTDYLGRDSGGPLSAMPRMAAPLHTPLDLAESLVRGAFAGGAGDNIAVGVGRARSA